MTHPTHGDLARRLEGLNLYLVGMMGTGKSAVGRPLAAALGYRFLDADTSVERVAGRSIPELFAEVGEPGFRDLETAVLGQIASWHSLVVATGGGVVTRPENWGHMQQGVVVWLDAPPELLLSRLAADPSPRPLLQTADPESQLTSLLSQRQRLYAHADLHIRQAGEPIEEVAAAVLAQLPTILKQRQAPPQQPAMLQNAEGQTSPFLN
jgi:shikimate kinase